MPASKNAAILRTFTSHHLVFIISAEGKKSQLKQDTLLNSFRGVSISTQYNMDSINPHYPQRVIFIVQVFLLISCYISLLSF